MAKTSLVDRNELIERITAESDEIITDNAHAVGMHNGLELAKAMVLNAPIIDAQLVVYGRWEQGICVSCQFDLRELTDGENDLKQWVWDEGFNFCPICGAKMY